MSLRRPGSNRKKVGQDDGAGGGHGGGWFVTFADLMGLMTSFFVMMVSFSHQDEQKLQIVAGSMREAFGMQQESRYSGILETDGVPTRGQLKNVKPVVPEQASPTPSQDEGGALGAAGKLAKAERDFAMASASLRQALQDLPELTEISKNVMFEETKEGLNLQIVDQDGRPMFPEGSPVPYERTQRLIERLAAPLRTTALRITLVGHTASGAPVDRSDYDAFDLSWQRANAVRQILKREGLPISNVLSVAGKADSEPLFPDHPGLAANRRVTITLLRENPPLPPGLTP
jgi:chemotaxis protein MotB